MSSEEVVLSIEEASVEMVWTPLGGALPAPPELEESTVKYNWGSVGLPYLWAGSFGDYMDEEPVQGDVWKGLVSGQRVAVKVFQRQLMQTQTQWASTLREIETQRTLQHPHLVRVVAVYQTPLEVHLVMPLADCSLFEFMVDRGTVLPEHATAAVVSQVLSALDYMHRRRTVHRDIKPENIVLRVSGRTPRAALCDFGWAMTVDSWDETISVGEPVGTLEYAPPEVLDGVSGELKSMKTGELRGGDMFSLGLMMYCLLYGSNPFDAPDVADRRQLMRSPPRRVKVPQSRMQRTVRALLSEQIDDRPSAAEALALCEPVAHRSDD